VILLDTNVISEMMRLVPAPRVVEWFDKTAGQTMYTTMINQAELLAGVAALPLGKRRSRLASEIGKVLTIDFAGKVLLFDDAASRAYAEIVTIRKRRVGHVAENDCQIAAIARSRQLNLATRNVKDFQHCGVDLIDPWA
jgi:toxin FitB